MGGVWLEYSYGWKPLVQDIYTAVNVVQRPFPFRTVRGKAHGKYALSVPYGNYTTHQYYWGISHYSWDIRLLLQANVSVSNWVAWRANELGLTNPLSVAWEVIPFSFAVDWFVPIGNYLQSLTDFVGLNLEDSFVTWYGTLTRDDQPMWFGQTNVYPHQQDQRVDLTRRLVIPSPPKLHPRFTGFYSARGANAIALLTTTLRDLPNIRPDGRRFKMSRDMYNWDRNLF
jgi:hypothetical protein